MTEREAIEAVRRAILVAGPHPRYHAEIMRKQRAEWPTLWNALDELLKSEQT